MRQEQTEIPCFKLFAKRSHPMKMAVFMFSPEGPQLSPQGLCFCLAACSANMQQEIV